MPAAKRLIVALSICVAALVAVGLWLSMGRESGGSGEQMKKRDKTAPDLVGGRVAGEDGERSELEATPEAMVRLSPFETRLELVDPEELQVEAAHQHTLGSWLTTLRPTPSEWRLEGDILRLRLTTPDGVGYRLALDVNEEYGPGKGLFAGTVEGNAFSEALFSYVGEAVSGVIRLPELGIAWEFRNKGGGLLELEKVDLSRLKDCAACRQKE